MKRDCTYIVEIKRAIRDFMNKLDVMSSDGKLNSDGIKAIARIMKLLKRSGLRNEAEKLERRLRKRGDMEVIASLLLHLEEKLS